MLVRYFSATLMSLACSRALGIDVCASPTSTADVISCVETNHPEVQKTRANELLINGILKKAHQFPNPILALGTNKGKSLGDVLGEDTATLSQLIEIGGKRSARDKRARAESEGLRASENLTKAQARIQALTGLVKYRQLTQEIGVLEEALRVYTKVHGQFATRPRLTPEQQVSFGIFKLAMGDYQHKLAAVESERVKTESFFRLIPELNVTDALKYLPPRIAKWPTLPAANPDLAKSPQILEANAALKQADADADLAKADAWPDPVVSVTAFRDVEGISEYQKFGIGISLPLPVFNLNGGERNQKIALRTKAEIEFRNFARKTELDRENLLFSYRNFVIALDKSPAPKDIEIKHRKTEELFYRGVISGVLVIEAHRQILEFTQTQNELELETIQALLSLYLYDGRLADFKYE